MRSVPFQFMGVLAAGLLAGCGNGSEQSPPELLTSQAYAAPAAPAEYKLTPEEEQLDCKKLTGRMQVRILQIRDYTSRDKTSVASRSLQSAATPVFGGTTAGADPDQRYRQDRAVLEAYNRQLAAKNCKTFNLEVELQPKSHTATPTPASPKKTP